MHIGCCKNCRYLDLMEYESDECPRCGDTMVSLGITTSEWNRMTTEERNNVVSDRFPRGEDSIRAVERLWKKKKVEPYIFNLRAQDPGPDSEPLDLLEEEGSFEEQQEKVINKASEKKLDIDEWLESKKVLEKHTKELPLIEPEDLFRAAAKRQKKEETIEPPSGFVEIIAGAQEGAEDALLPEESPAGQEPADPESADPEPTEPGIEDSEYIYVCYMCNSIAAHEDGQGPYHCEDCGASMISTGCTRTKWSDLSKEQKRREVEDAKIRHMANAINNSPFDDSDSENTQNIINVVKNKDLA